MEQIPSYDLLQAIDPTKIKVPISERFAKLTLSSNKKQQEKCVRPDDEEELKKQQMKRDSVSRNISKQFEDENKENKQSSDQNPLLRSESSKEAESNNSPGADVEELTMEPLEVSEDNDNPTQMEDDIELISQQIVSMAIEPNPISVSSGSSINLSVFTELVSTDSSTIDDVNNIHIVRHIPINIEEAAKRNTIHLDLTSSTNDKTNEITEDEDQEDYEAITISDASESHHEEKQDIMSTSSLPSTSISSQSLRLPSLTDDKAERVAAFLRDVSIQRRAMEAQGHIDFKDFVDQMLEKKEIHKIQETLEKSRQLATADTESMTPDLEEEVVASRSQLEREKRLKALEVEEKETFHLKNSDTKHDLYSCKTPTSEQVEAKNVHRLANDETQDNTVMTESEQEKEGEKIPNNISKIKTPLRRCSPETPKNCEKDIYRIANDETQCNSEHFVNERTPQIRTVMKNRNPLNVEKSPRPDNLETEFSRTEQFLSPNKNKEMDARRLINEDTMANTIMSDIDEALTQQSVVHNYSKDYKTPEKGGKTVLNEETRNNISISLNSTPQSSTDDGHKQKSFASFFDSSTELNETVPEHSITILETDDDNCEQTSPPPKSENSENKKLSNSFHREDSSDDSDYDERISQIQMSMANINISAKINIKIHISNMTSTETSEDEKQKHNRVSETSENARMVSTQTTPESQTKSNEVKISPVNDHSSVESNDQSTESEPPEKSNNQKQLKAPVKEIAAIANKSLDSVESVEDEESEPPEKPNNQKQLKAPVKEIAIIVNKSLDSVESVEDEKSEPLEKPKKQWQLKAPEKEIATIANKSSDSVESAEDEKFLTEAEKLLNQLYGKEWQTPEVIRTLKKTGQSGDKKSNTSKSSSKKKNNIKSANKEKSKSKLPVEESILDDFSIFRRNIVKTNLDSTRLVTPKPVKRNKEVFTEPRNTKKSVKEKEKTTAKHMPQTEQKPLGPPTARVLRNKRPVDNDRWRRLVVDDTDSEGDNASDDEDADESWSKIASDLELEDSDLENSPPPKTTSRKHNTTKRQGRSNKSDHLTKVLDQTKAGEIVYLDLSKEEVEVQDQVSESPPANHDVTFASRLEDILKTCRREDKPKLPASNKKTKRKLFTPNFGDDAELDLTKEQEENTAKINYRNNEREEEILEDNGICPFDRQGRPKVLNFVNKQLEVVKTGKPIFQLTPTKGSTPNPKDKNNKNNVENTPKTKSDKDVKFKTPLTIKSKGVVNDFNNLRPTPDFKYSFLKSLDVSISKTLCHPDALFYRDNYRTKKEDLTKILYDMYNQKLFENTLDVPIKWNKKLLNTAGRCLNKKKLGVRSSVIELSEKVLTSADRLRCTLIHELCHAATWIFSGEGGHGSTWKEWARRANATFPEIPKIGVCHQYDIEYKYTYKCSLCGAKSNAHSKSKKVENIRCSYCHGAIEIFLNKKDKDGNVIPTPVKEPTGFAKFVQENYKKFKRDNLKHADIMKLLSNEFASLKIATN